MAKRRNRLQRGRRGAGRPQHGQGISIARTLSLLNKLWDGAPHIVDRATAAKLRRARRALDHLASTSNRMSWAHIPPGIEAWQLPEPSL